MRKKLLSLLLTGAMTATLLAGCGNTAAPAASPETTKKEEAAASVEEAPAQESSAEEAEDDAYFTDEKGNTFFTDTDGTVYYVDMDGTKYKKFDDVVIDYLILFQDSEVLLTPEQQLDNPYTNAIRDKIGVTLQVSSVDIVPAEKINMMTATDSLPTMCAGYYGKGSDPRTIAVRKAIDEGMLYDITDLVPEYENIKDAWSPELISEGWINAELDRPENKGRRYVIPHDIAASTLEFDSSSSGVSVRADVLEKLGVDPLSIRTTDQLYDFMMAAKDYGFKDVNGNDCIVAGTMENGWAYENYFFNLKEKKISEFSLDDNGELVYDVLKQNFLDRYMFIWKMVKNGLLDVECFTQNEETANQKCGNGTYLFTATNYSSALNRQKKTGLYYEHPELRYVPLGPLNWSNGDPGTDLRLQGKGEPEVTFFSAKATEEEVEAALTYMNYVSGKEGAMLSGYGFEGETYELDENGRPRMNQKWSDMCLEIGSTDTNKKLTTEYGLDYVKRVGMISHKKEWFGEFSRWSTLAFNEVDEYCERRPVETVPGISADSFASQYSNYAELVANCLDVSRKNDYVFRAFFANTEEEALSILKSYQDFIRNYNNGEMEKLYAEMKEMMEGQKIAW